MTIDDVRRAVDAGDHAKALRLIDELVEAGALDPQLLLLRAQCYEHTGQREKAALDYANLASLLGGHPDALVPVAIQLANLGCHDDELAIYDRILAQAPDHFDGNYLKALRLVKMGRWRECLAFIDRAIEVSPSDGNAHYTKACAHALLGERDAAIASVRKALEVEPSLRSSIAMDEDFASIESDPEFRKLVGRSSD